MRAAHHQRRLQAARLGASWMAPLGNLACVGAVVLGQATLVLHLDGSARGGVLLSPLLVSPNPHLSPNPSPNPSPKHLTSTKVLTSK